MNQEDIMYTSTIRVTYDVVTKKWTVEKNFLENAFVNVRSVFETDVEFCFRQNGSQNVTFDNTSFGYTFKYGQQVVGSDDFPKGGRVLIASDQDVMQHIRFEFTPGEKYTMNFWVNYAGERQTFDYQVTFPGYTLVDFQSPIINTEDPTPQV